MQELSNRAGLADKMETQHARTVQ